MSFPVFSLSPSTPSTPARPTQQYPLQNALLPPVPSQLNSAQPPLFQIPSTYSFTWPPPGQTGPPQPPPPAPFPPYMTYPQLVSASQESAASPTPKSNPRTSKENVQPTPNSKTPKRKKGADNDSSAHERRVKKAYNKTVVAAKAPPPAACGVGPSESPASTDPIVLPPPHEHQNPVIERSASRLRRGYRTPSEQHGQKAVDIWPFIYGLHSGERHDVPISGGVTDHPKTAWLGCKLCIDAGSWKVYKNSNSGLTSNLRRHLQEKHKNDWYRFCVASGYLRDDTSSQPGNSSDLQTTDILDTSQPFSVAKFQELLVDWVAVDDQAVNVVECTQFRRLLAYISPSLNQNNILHRGKLTDLIYARYETVYKEILSILQNTPGRVSFTFDGWSDKNLGGFLAVTAHHATKNLQGRLELKTHLVAFRRMEGPHDGDNIGGTFFRVLKETQLLGKVGLLSTDNAASNGTAFKRIEHDLRSINITFDAEGNRIGCFPHSSALGTTAFMTEIKDNPREPIIRYAHSLSEREEREHAIRYADALASDPVGRIRSLVAACRASGQRRDDLKAVIKNGNEAKRWEHIRPGGVPVLRLLRDCPTRWSSTYMMIDRVLLLYPAIEAFLALPKHVDIAHHALTSIDIEVLEDIHDILEKSADVQQVLSGESTPTVAFTFPTYEALVTSLTKLASDLPIMRHYINLNVLKLKEYFLKCRRSRIFALAMLLRPDTKINHLPANLGWTREEAEQAKEWMIEAMVAHRTAYRHKAREAHHGKTHVRATTTDPPSVLPQSSNGHSTRPRYTSQRHLRQSGSSSTSDSSSQRGNRQQSVALESSGNTNTEEPDATTSAQRNEAQIEAAELMHDRAMCEKEFTDYQNEPVVRITHGGDLLNYWSDNERAKPFLYLVALDVLPAQASSVSCERVFSSSKETDAARRSRTDPSLMEVLQVLKYHCRHNQPAFRHMDDLAPKEEDYTIEGPVTATAARELIASGQYDVLRELLANSY